MRKVFLNTLLVLILKLSIVSSSVAENAIKCESKRGLLQELLVPRIRITPYHNDLEFPAWAVNMLPETELAQHGGYDSFNYVVETVREEDEPAVVAIATERFKTAPGWDSLHDWLDERNTIASAPEYKGRKKTWMTRPKSELGKPVLGSKVETTGGIVFGEFTAHDLENKTDEEIYNNLSFRLPQEKTLKTPVTRYFDPDSKKGIAIELRALSKDPVSTPAWLRDEQMNRMIIDTLEVAKKYPKLYDKPIVTFYADPWHLEKYVGTEAKPGWLRANIQEKTTPLNHPLFLRDKGGKIIPDPPFWICEVSPKTLEQVLIDRLKGGKTIENLNLPHPFELPNGVQAMGKEGAQIAFDSDGNATLATLKSQTEIAPGVIAAPGSTAWWVDQNLARVDAISKPYTLKHKFFEAVAPAGSTLEWDSPYLKLWSRGNPENVFYRPNIDDLASPHVGSPDEWQMQLRTMRAVAEHRTRQIVSQKNTSDPIFMNEMNKQARIYRKKNWPSSSLARMIASPTHPIMVSNLNIAVTQLEISEENYGFRVAKNTPLPKNVALGEGLVAAEGTDLELEKTSQGWSWKRICLGKDAVVQGKKYKKGVVLLEIDGKVLELTEELTHSIPYGP